MTERPVRIVHVVETLERGGLERMVVDLARMQHAQGHDVCAVCLFVPGVLAPELHEAGIPVQACGKRDGFDLGALRRLRGLLREGQGGVLHTHNAAAHYHAVLASAGLRHQRVVNTRHGMGGAGRGSRREWLYRRSLGRTDVVAAVCEAARASFQAQGVRPRGRLIAVPNGIRVERFAQGDATARAQLASSLGLGDDARLVGTVGRLNPVKDQALLLRAFANVHAALPEAALVLVGEGPSHAELVALATELGISARVRFLGDRSDVDRILAGLDVFVLSSRSEGYSIALLEACAAGLPIVATDVGGNGEIVRDGRNGRLVPAGDASALSLALLDVLQDPQTAARMGLAGHAWAQAHASLRAMASRYEALYEGRA